MLGRAASKCLCGNEVELQTTEDKSVEPGSARTSLWPWNGQSALRHSSHSRHTIVLPVRGGKIASFRYTSAREWPEPPDRALAASTPASIVEEDMFGWGECAPTIVACPVGAALLPDHGQLCSSSRNGSKYWWLTVRGRTFDYDSARKLTATDSRLDFAYRGGSFNSSPPFLWAAYPQCRAEQGTAILPPGDISEPVGILCQPTQLTSAADFRRATETQPSRCRNDYVDPAPSLTQARVQHADGSTLILFCIGTPKRCILASGSSHVSTRAKMRWLSNPRPPSMSATKRSVTKSRLANAAEPCLSYIVSCAGRFAPRSETACDFWKDRSHLRGFKHPHKRTYKGRTV